MKKNFNNLKSRSKWDTWKERRGTWHCPECDVELKDGPHSTGPFPRATIQCSNCDALLTRRTGGGQMDPFRWVLKEPVPPDVTIGWSDFALERHNRKAAIEEGFSYSCLTDEQILNLVRDNLDKAIPGTGEKDLTRKILVPVPAKDEDGPLFYTSIVLLKEAIPVSAMVTKRRPEEDPFIQNYITPKQAMSLGLKSEPANFVKIVCYSAEALAENNERSGDCDWEIIAIVASPVENEPMPPLTMARNMLEKEGGTKSVYTADEFAEAIYYWSQRIKINEL